MLKWPDSVLLDEEQRAFAEKVLAFARKDIAPLAPQADESFHLEMEVFRRLAAFGLFRYVVPVEYGGNGVFSVRVCLVRELLSSV
ncbi:MAG: acyl-CoA dehydrogenase family protein, partial [Dehalococcoidia bacterium]|nr:acyl-CoA dehydrogenase family protein [Dehalococcoidia bacterium]